MTATAIPGRLGRVRINVDGGVTQNFLDIKGIVDQTLNGNLSEYETTSHDSAGHKEFIPGLDDATVDLSCRWLESDPAQIALWASYFNKTTLGCQLTFDTVSGHSLFTGQCFPTSMSGSAPNDDVASLDITLRLSGMNKSSQ